MFYSKGHIVRCGTCVLINGAERTVSAIIGGRVFLGSIFEAVDVADFHDVCEVQS